MPPTLANSTPNTSASNADPVEFAGDDLIIVARQDVLDPVATSPRAWALQSDPDFSEVEVDAGTNVLNVYRASDRLDESARAGYAGIAGDVALTFKPAQLSAVQDRELADLVDSNSGVLSAPPDSISHWGLDVVGGSFTIAYKGNNPKSYLTDVLGKRPVEGVSVEQIKFIKGGATPASRTADTPPFYGGSRIHGPLDLGGDPNKFETCSSAFGVRSPSGTTYLVTAWHCYKYNDTRIWTNRDTNNLLIGNVTADAWNTTVKSDASFIRVNAFHRVFDGTDPNPRQSKNVVGMSLPNAGDYVCASGGYSAIRCDARVGTGADYYVANGYSGATPSCKRFEDLLTHRRRDLWNRRQWRSNLQIHERKY